MSKMRELMENVFENEHTLHALLIEGLLQRLDIDEDDTCVLEYKKPILKIEIKGKDKSSYKCELNFKDNFYKKSSDDFFDCNEEEKI